MKSDDRSHVIELIVSILVAGTVAFLISRSGNKKATEEWCLEGHVYYVVKSAYGSSIAPKLDDDGKPVPCLEKE